MVEFRAVKTQKDADVVLSIEKQCWHLKQDRWRWGAIAFLQASCMEGAACLLAKRNDKDVGYVFLRRMSGNVFMLLNFGVATIFRRTGVGREMLTKLCDLAGDSGIIVTGCSVDDAPFNNLLSLCGFSFVGKRKDDEMGELNMYQFVGKELKNVLESE